MPFFGFLVVSRSLLWRQFIPITKLISYFHGVGKPPNWCSNRPGQYPDALECVEMEGVDIQRESSLLSEGKIRAF